MERREPRRHRLLGVAHIACMMPPYPRADYACRAQAEEPVTRSGVTACQPLDAVRVSGCAAVF